MARSRGDKDQIGILAQNLGIVCQEEGEAARKQGDDVRARERFTEAARFVEESLDVWREKHNEPNEAASYGQLGQIHMLLDDLDKAEVYAHQARAIRERLELKEAWKDYNTLASIARARKKPEEAAAWEQKRAALLAELKRRAGPSVNLQALVNVAVACAQAGLNRATLDPQIEEAVAGVAKALPPLDSLAPFLRALAAGNLPDLPAALPAEITAVLQQVIEAVKEAQG